MIALGAYVLGCFVTGYYLVRRRVGCDLRNLGSGSAGARNVARVLGPSGFAMVLAGDFAKGAFAVWSAQHFTNNDHLVALAMLMVVAGHIWPAQLAFRGGKGAATSFGALLVYDFHLALALALLFAAGFIFVRKAILPGLFAFGFLPVVSTYIGHTSAQTVEISVLAGLVLIAHRRNLLSEISHLLEPRAMQPKHNPPDL